ncbi:MAG TPA: hypothetical protein VMW76_10865 [Bacteroidales bacterium]|nr:hypothetical protein [Bacteroidales bacterium]
MTDTNTKPDSGSRNDEIDLLQLFRSFGDFIVRIFKGLFNLILQFIIFSIRKSLYLIAALLLTVLTSYLKVKIQDEIFYSDLVLKSNAVQNQEMISYINRLQGLTSKVNHRILADELNIPVEKAELVSDITAYWFVDKNRDGIVDDIDLNNRFIADTNIDKISWKFGIRASVKDPQIFEEVTTGVINYINSNEYFRQANEARLKNLKETIDQTGKEIYKLDSLQKREYFREDESTRLKEGQLVFTNDPEIKLFHADLLDLLRDKQVRERELGIDNGIISLREGFTLNQQPENSITYYAKKSILIYIGLAYLIALFITYRKKLLEFLRN